MFYFRRRVGKRLIRRKLGHIKTISLAEARELCRREFRRLVLPSDLTAHEITFAEIFERYTRDHAEVHSTSKTLEGNSQVFKSYLTPIHDTALADLDRAALVGLHKEIYSGPRGRGPSEKKRPYAANRALQLASAVLGYAVREGITQFNPAAGIRHYPESSRSKCPDLEQCRRLFKVAEQIYRKTSEDGALLVMLALTTGARRTNLLTIEESEINRESWCWTIPAKKHKAKRDQRIYLIPKVSSLIAARSSCSGRIFKMVEPRRALARLGKLAGIDHFSLHGLRHAFVSAAHEIGIDPLTIAAMAGHTIGTITARYTHIRDGALKDAFEKLGQAMSLSPKPQS